VQSLKHEDEGPLELTRRQKVLVWDDEVETTDGQDGNDVQPVSEAVGGPASPHASINTVPLPTPSSRLARPKTLQSSISEFPPRRSGELPRPVSFSAKYPRVHPATTGVAILEHMERLDAVEASLKRLPLDHSLDEDEEESDVADSSKPKAVPPGREVPIIEDLASSVPGLFTDSGLSSVPEVPSSSTSEEDVAAISKSLSHIDISPPALHTRWTSQLDGRRGLDWIVDDSESPKSRTVIVERLETVNAKPVFSC